VVRCTSRRSASPIYFFGFRTCRFRNIPNSPNLNCKLPHHNVWRQNGLPQWGRTKRR
jgi:hypothetical protein